MILIFEGPDHSGKDHLIEQLRTPNTFYFHNGAYPTPNEAYSAFMSQIDVIENYLTTTFHKDPKIFLNRSHISEQIYSRCCREEFMNRNQVEEIDDRLLNLGARVIRCLPPKNIVMAGWAIRNEQGKEFINDKAIMEKVYDMYVNIEDWTKIGYIHHDYTKTTEFAIGETYGYR